MKRRSIEFEQRPFFSGALMVIPFLPKFIDLFTYGGIDAIPDFSPTSGRVAALRGISANYRRRVDWDRVEYVYTPCRQIAVIGNPPSRRMRPSYHSIRR